MSNTFNTAEDFDNLLVELDHEQVDAAMNDAMLDSSYVVSLSEVHLEQGAGARWCRQETI